MAMRRGPLLYCQAKGVQGAPSGSSPGGLPEAAKPEEEPNEMHKPIKYVEKALSYAARAAWTIFDSANQVRQNPSFTPKWSDKPLLKSYQKTKPPLGWPRDTDSLCPRCVPEARKEILDGKKPLSILLNEKVGEI